MTLRFFKILSCTLIAFFLTHVYAGEPQSDFLTVYTEQSFPLSYTRNNRNDEPILGHGTELVRAVLEHSGIDFKIEIVPWVRAIQAINNKENVMVYSMTRSKDREEEYYWIGEIIPLEYYLFGLKENLGVLPRTLDQARKFRVGVVREDVVSNYLAAKEFETLVTVSATSRNLHMLQRRRIDLFPYNIGGVSSFLKANNFDPENYIGVVKLEEISTGMYMAVSKHTNINLVAKLRSSYHEIVESGIYDDIILPFQEKGMAERVEILNYNLVCN